MKVTKRALSLPCNPLFSHEVHNKCVKTLLGLPRGSLILWGKRETASAKCQLDFQGSLILNYKGVNTWQCAPVLVWMLPEADPETKTWMQEVNLAGDSRNTCREVGTRSKEEKIASKKHRQAGYLCRQQGSANQGPLGTSTECAPQNFPIWGGMSWDKYQLPSVTNWELLGAWGVC